MQKVHQVDLFSIVLMGVSIPAAFFSFYYVDGIGFKKTMWMIAASSCSGLTMRLGTLFHEGTNNEFCQKNITIDPDFPDWYCPAPNWSYYVALFGNVLMSIGAGLKCGLPSKLASQWFESNERDLANSIASLADTLGIMLACLLSPLFVKKPSDLKKLEIYFAIPAYIGSFGTLFIQKEGYILKPEEMSFKVINYLSIKLNVKQDLKEMKT